MQVGAFGTLLRSEAAWAAANAGYAPTLAAPWREARNATHDNARHVLLRGGQDEPPCSPDALLNLTRRAIAFLGGVEHASASLFRGRSDVGFAALDAQTCVSERVAFKNGRIQTSGSCYSVLPHSDMYDYSLANIDTFVSAPVLFKQHLTPSARNKATLDKVLGARRDRGIGLLLRDPLTSFVGYMRRILEGNRKHVAGACHWVNQLAGLIAWHEGWRAYAEARPDNVTLTWYVDIADPAHADCHAVAQLVKRMGMSECAALIERKKADRMSERKPGPCHIKLRRRHFTGNHVNASKTLAGKVRMQSPPTPP